MPKPVARSKRSKPAARAKSSPRSKAAAHAKRRDEARVQDNALDRRSDRLDEALELTFPASDPIAVGNPTSTEPLFLPSADGQEAARPAAAPHWIELCVLPWATWTALGLMMMTGRAWIANKYPRKS